MKHPYNSRAIAAFALFMILLFASESLAQSNTDCVFLPECDTFAATVKWQSAAPTGNYPALVAGDIDNDGVPEVIANRPFSTIFYILDGTTGATELTFNSPAVPGDGAGIAIGDIDNDGFGEIVVPAGGRVYAFEHTGVLKFTGDVLPGTGRTVVSLADFDGDGNTEAYVANYIVSGQTGALLASAGIANSKGRAPFRGDFDQPVAVDALADAFCADCAGLELVCGNVVYAVNLTAGTMIAVSNAPFGYSDGYTSIADYDQDGDVDALVQGRLNGVNTMYAWDLQTSSILGAIPTGLNVAGRVNISDLDGDGELEASFAGRNAIIAVDNDFSLLWQRTTQDFSSGITGTSVFDFCGDGSFEVAYRDELQFRVYDGSTGNILWSTGCTSATHIENPLILDVDADGQTEMVISCGNNTFAFESSTTPWLPSREVWNQHAYFNTNVNDDLSIPATQLEHWTLGDSVIFNTFMNQRPPVDSTFTPVYVAADVYFASSSLTCVNDTGFVDLEICNQGDNAFPSGVPITFYDADPTLSAANVIGSGTTSSIILPGNCTTETFAFPVSANTVFAVVNDNGSTPTPFDLALDFPNTPVGECEFTNDLTSFSVAPCDITYCTSEGLISSYEWIENISFATLNNTSGDNGGYADFSSMITNVTAGNNLNLVLTPGYSNQMYTEFWSIYVDWNQDGDFFDLGEDVFQGNGIGAINASFVVPTNAASGALRMRVSMAWSASGSCNCGHFSYGEVEDYSLMVAAQSSNITVVDRGENSDNLGRGLESQTFSRMVFTGLEVREVYPNPVIRTANNFVNVDFRVADVNQAWVRIMDPLGKVLIQKEVKTHEGENHSEINISQLPAGVFIVEVKTNTGVWTEKLLVH